MGEPESVYGEEPEDVIVEEPEDFDETQDLREPIVGDEPLSEIEPLPVLEDEDVADEEGEIESEIAPSGPVCTCQETTKDECEASGDEKIEGECTWQASHGKCRNTEWLECKQDPKCLWMQITPKCHKSKQQLKTQILDKHVQEIEEIEFEDVVDIEDKEVDVQYDEEEYIEEEFVGENDENEMIVNRSGMLSSSIKTQSDNIR